ncbi:MAG: RidA family protein [Alphaproteobacteria bacterium]
MHSRVEDQLSALGVTLPAPAAPAANYVPYTISGSQIYVSGQVPVGPSGLEFQGKLGAGISLEDGQAAARLCAINLLAQARAAAGGDLDRIRCIKLGGFVNCTPDFDQHPAVMNGASDLIAQALAPHGTHARFAVGAPSLPFNVAVEVDGLFELI